MRIYLLTILMLIPIMVSSQNEILANDSSTCEQYPEIKKCRKKKSIESAKKCFSKQIQKHVNKKVNYNYIRKVVNKTLKDTMRTEHFEKIRGKRVRAKNRIGIILGKDKEWHVRSVETEYPRLIPYFEKLFEDLPKIKKTAICSGEPVDIIFHFPLHLEVPIE